MDRSQKIEAVFKRLDKDRSGDIDKSEIKRFFKKAAGENHAQRNETADKLLDYFDKDGDGCIDYDEFKQGIKNLERGEGAAFLKSKLEFFFENERVDPKDGQLKTFALFLKHSTDKQDAQVSTGAFLCLCPTHWLPLVLYVFTQPCSLKLTKARVHTQINSKFLIFVRSCVAVAGSVGRGKTASR